MVEIKYCSECLRAKREHFKKSPFCTYCGSHWEPMEVPRSRYFAIMLPFWILGAILHLYVFVQYVTLLNKPDELNSQRFFLFGMIIFGIASYIFALGFQYLDSKTMEKEAEKLGSSRVRGIDGRNRAAVTMRGPRMDVPVRKPRDRPAREARLEEEKEVPVRRPPKPSGREKPEEEDERPKKEKGTDSEDLVEEGEKEEKKKDKKKGKKKEEDEEEEPPKRKKQKEEVPASPPRKMARKIRTR